MKPIVAVVVVIVTVVRRVMEMSLIAQ